jgi:hypothetical protein
VEKNCIGGDYLVNSILIFIITSLIGSLGTLICKLFKDMMIQKTAIRSLLRSEMVKTYYEYKDIKKMPFFVREAWYMTYEAYKKSNGNSFIDSLKEEIDNWEVKK